MGTLQRLEMILRRSFLESSFSVSYRLKARNVAEPQMLIEETLANKNSPLVV
jgi:hypothetical protein